MLSSTQKSSHLDHLAKSYKGDFPPSRLKLACISFGKMYSTARSCFNASISTPEAAVLSRSQSDVQGWCVCIIKAVQL